MAATILGVGATTPVGLSAATTAAALRAGIARISQYAFDPVNEPAVALAWLHDEALPRLARELATCDERRARLVRLASYPLVEAFAGASGPTALFLALAQEGPEDDRDDRRIIADLALQTGVALDLAASRVIRRGRVGGLLALEEALACLDKGLFARVCVGGVDSHYDSAILQRLALEGRLHSEDTGDGFIPGEGAAFVMLGAPRSRGVRVVAAAHAGAKPLREGLALAFQALLDKAHAPPIQHVYAGATGENVWAREWSIARLRCAPYFAADASLDHPAEFIGDTGAALGPLLIVLATIGLTRGVSALAVPDLVRLGQQRPSSSAAHILSRKDLIMASTVLANGRGVAHKQSGGLSTVFPDVCKTPTPSGPVPLPYPNVGRAADTSGGPKSVRTDGAMPMVKGATYRKTSGDEPGTAGGVISSTNRGSAEFSGYSFDVRIEGRNACRLGDPLFHNKKNTAG